MHNLAGSALRLMLGFWRHVVFPGLVMVVVISICAAEMVGESREIKSSAIQSLFASIRPTSVNSITV
jgi:hypothetical protein